MSAKNIFITVCMLLFATGVHISYARAQGLSLTLFSPPPKVVRYADILIKRYDKNSDGVLQQEEWERMPGRPMIMDIDGDGRITKDELVRHIAQYGQARTIHRPVAPDLTEPYRFDPANLRLFRPVWQRPVAPPPVVQEEPVPDEYPQDEPDDET